MKPLKVTTVMIVPSVEVETRAWQDLGFAALQEVPHDGGVGFAILAAHGIEIMLQTLASLEADLPAVAAALGSRRSYLFVDVDDVVAFRTAAKDSKVLVGSRETFYGTRETFLQLPSGEVVGFAQKI